MNEIADFLWSKLKNAVIKVNNSGLHVSCVFDAGGVAEVLVFQFIFFWVNLYLLK